MCMSIRRYFTQQCSISRKIGKILLYPWDNDLNLLFKSQITFSITDLSSLYSKNKQTKRKKKSKEERKNTPTFPRALHLITLKRSINISQLISLINVLNKGIPNPVTASPCLTARTVSSPGDKALPFLPTTVSQVEMFPFSKTVKQVSLLP